MATYDSLTAEQKASVQNADNNLRSFMGQLLAMFTTGEVFDEELLAGVEDLVDGLDAGEVIPNSTGLRGSVALDKAEWKLMVTYLRAFNDLETDAVRQLLIKAAGANRALSTERV